MDRILDELTPDTHLAPEIIAFRLFAAVILSAAIGLEREAKNRPAGLRTHTLVGLAAALLAVVTIEIIHAPFASGIAGATFDPIRVIEAVTAGVAFLGAGAIIQGRGGLHGVTTGSALWMAGAIGVACGLGYALLAIAAAVLTLLVLTVVHRLERRLGGRGEKPGAGAGPASADGARTD